MTAAYGSTVAAIIAALDECGPMTRAELSAHLGKDRTLVSAVVTRMARPTKDGQPKRLHVTNFVYDHEGSRRYPRAVYALGSYPDARKPKPDKAENKRRYDESRRLQQASSVFTFGQPRRTHRTKIRVI